VNAVGKTDWKNWGTAGSCGMCGGFSFRETCSHCKQQLCHENGCFEFHQPCYAKIVEDTLENKPIGTKNGDDVLPITEDGTLVRKYQKCGKKNCKCQQGKLHGPYWWRVKYVRKSESGKGHHRWKYVGKIDLT